MALKRRTEGELKLILVDLRMHTGSWGIKKSEVYFVMQPGNRAACIIWSWLSWLLKTTVAACCANCRRWNQFWPRADKRVNSSNQDEMKARIERLNHSLHLIIKTELGIGLLVAQLTKASTMKAPSLSPAWDHWCMPTSCLSQSTLSVALGYKIKRNKCP